MTWLIAPTALKGSLTAKIAAKVMSRALLDAIPQANVILCPIADGGTSTLECLIDGTQGRYFSSKVMGPLKEMKVNARWGILGDGKTCVIECAEAAGLHLLAPAQYDPLHATTFGVGLLIKEALDAGCKKFLIGLGGSATIDGGAGCMQALGCRLLNAQNKELPLADFRLADIARIDAAQVDPRFAEADVAVLSDVKAVLSGPGGAAFLFGEQKGASSLQIQELGSALEHFGNIIEQYIGRPVVNLAGSGAAGGLAVGLLALTHARISSGIDVVLDLLDVDAKLKNARGVLTAEGRLDLQTIEGKAMQGLINRANIYHRPVHAFVGCIDGDAASLQKNLGLTSLHVISPDYMSAEKAMEQACELMYEAVRKALISIKS